VDLGLGDEPTTTIELFHRLQTSISGVRVIGVDHELSRVERAQAEAVDGLCFVVGSFGLQSILSPVHVIRVCNVLREYSVQEAIEARRRLGRKLVDGGWLVDATSSTNGHVCVALLMQRANEKLHRRALWFFTNRAQGFSPIMLRNYLPRDLKRCARDGHPLEGMFNAWLSAWNMTRGHAEDTFHASVVPLIQGRHFSWEPPGVALWRPPLGVPTRDGRYAVIELDA